MNSDEFNAKFKEDVGTWRAWMQAHGKVTAVVVAVLVGFILGAVTCSTKAATLDIPGCDTLTVTSQTPTLITIACGHNAPNPSPSPPPSPAADYTIPPSLWTFGAQGSAGGNYRLQVVPNRARVTIVFTTAQVGKGALINLQWSSGAGSMHTMTVVGVSRQSQSPSFTFSTGNAVPNRLTLQPNTAYVITIDTPPGGLKGTYHLNFQNAPY